MSNSLANEVNINPIVFAERLKEQREKHSLTLTKLSEKTGITRQTLSNYENKNTKPKPYNLYTLAMFFNVPIDYFLGQDKVDSSFQQINEVSKYTGLSVAAIEMLHYHKLLLSYNDCDDCDDCIDENPCVFPNISVLLETFTVGDFPISILNLDSYLEEFFNCSKELRELELLLSECKQEWDYFEYNNRFIEYDKKTNGLMTNYKELFLNWYLKTHALSQEYKSDTILEVAELEIKKRELAKKICMIIPNSDLDNLDDLCENLLGPKSESRCIEKIDELKTKKARTLMDIIEYLIEASKDDRPYRVVRKPGEQFFRIQSKK